MPTEEKKKIQAWIPNSLWIQIESFGFKSQNEAVNFAFNKLIEIQANNLNESDLNQNESKNNQVESSLINQLQATIEEKDKQIKDFEYVSREKNAEILRLQKVIQEAPDPVELAEVRAHFEGLQKVLEEKERTIEILNRDVETLNVFAHYFKNTEVKQLEAPAVEKKRPWYRRIFST